MAEAGSWMGQQVAVCRHLSSLLCESPVAVTAERASKVLLVDVVVGTVQEELHTGQRLSHMVGISPDEKTFYTANITDGTLSIIPADGGAPMIVPV